MRIRNQTGKLCVSFQMCVCVFLPRAMTREMRTCVFNLFASCVSVDKMFSLYAPPPHSYPFFYFDRHEKPSSTANITRQFLKLLLFFVFASKREMKF